LGVVSVVAGIGLLLVKGWARTLVLWQAGCSMVLALSAFWFVPSLQPVITDLMLAGATDNAQAEAFLHRLVTVGGWGLLGISVGIGLAWNAFLLWFFNRGAIKSQFQQAA